MRYKGNLVLLELLIALAFFAISAVIGAGVLAKAYKMNVDSRRTTDAMFIAQRFAEDIAAADDPIAFLNTFGRKADGAYTAEHGGYTVSAVVTPEQTRAGTLYGIRLSVLLGDKALVTLPASRYVPGEVSP